MKIISRLWLPLLTVSLSATDARAAIAVGASSLIGTLDYSDTFAIGTGASGTRNGTAYSAGAFPITLAPLLQVENSYGNTVRSWSPSLWSLNNDAVFLSGSLVYPGGSGGGSVSGFTQTGNGLDYGIEYDLRNKFVVQFDAVQTVDRVDITVTNTRNGLAGANGLSIFFRANGSANLGNSAEVGIYNPALGEVLAPFDTGSASVDVGEWHNYAVSFDLVTLQLGLYVDQISLGTIDLNTFGGTKFGGGTVAPGAFAALVSAATNDAISVGAAGGNRVWTDNFQVGSAVPEPGAATLSLAAAGTLMRRRRREG